MTHYLVEVSCYHPYKREKQYTIPASNHGVAIARAVSAFRRQVIPGKKVAEITAKARRM